MTREDLLKAMTKPLYQMDLQQRMVPGERTDAEFEEEWEYWKARERHKNTLPMHAAHERAKAALAALEAAGFLVVNDRETPISVSQAWRQLSEMFIANGAGGRHLTVNDITDNRLGVISILVAMNPADF